MSYQVENFESFALYTPSRPSVAIRGIGLVSPAGVGVEAFSQALNASQNQSLGEEINSSKSMFDAPAELGRKGLSSLDRMSRMAIISCREALSSLTITPGRTGVVLGNSGGSFASISEFVASTYTAEQPHLVSPLKFPNTVMNCAASQCAIRLGLTGINSTVCAGDMSGFHALAYSIRSLRLGHADSLVAGSVEECCEYTENAHHAIRGFQRMADGCAFVGLEKCGPVVDLMTGPVVLGTRSRRIRKGETSEQALFACLSKLCIETASSMDELAWVSLPDSYTPSLPKNLKEVLIVKNRATSTYGDFRTASVSFRLADLLLQKPVGKGLLIAVSMNEVGCALLDGLSS